MKIIFILFITFLTSAFGQGNFEIESEPIGSVRVFHSLQIITRSEFLQTLLDSRNPNSRQEINNFLDRNPNLRGAYDRYKSLIQTQEFNTHLETLIIETERYLEEDQQNITSVEIVVQIDQGLNESCRDGLCMSSIVPGYPINLSIYFFSSGQLAADVQFYLDFTHSSFGQGHPHIERALAFREFIQENI